MSTRNQRTLMSLAHSRRSVKSDVNTTHNDTASVFSLLLLIELICSLIFLYVVLVNSIVIVSVSVKPLLPLSPHPFASLKWL